MASGRGRCVLGKSSTGSRVEVALWPPGWPGPSRPPTPFLPSTTEAALLFLALGDFSAANTFLDIFTYGMFFLPINIYKHLDRLVKTQHSFGSQPSWAVGLSYLFLGAGGSCVGFWVPMSFPLRKAFSTQTGWFRGPE